MVEYKNTGGIQVGTFVTIDNPDENDYRVWRIRRIEPWYASDRENINYDATWNVYGELVYGDYSRFGSSFEKINGAYLLNKKRLMNYHYRHYLNVISVEKMIEDGKFNKKELKDIYIRYLEETLDKNGIEFERR